MWAEHVEPCGGYWRPCRCSKPLGLHVFSITGSSPLSAPSHHMGQVAPGLVRIRQQQPWRVVMWRARVRGPCCTTGAQARGTVNICIHAWLLGCLVAFTTPNVLHPPILSPAPNQVFIKAKSTFYSFNNFPDRFCGSEQSIGVGASVAI